MRMKLTLISHWGAALNGCHLWEREGTRFPHTHAHEADAYFPLGRSPRPLCVVFFCGVAAKNHHTNYFFGGLQPPIPRFAKRQAA
jgi:hypothetical protein